MPQHRPHLQRALAVLVLVVSVIGTGQVVFADEGSPAPSPSPDARDPFEALGGPWSQVQGGPAHLGTSAQEASGASAPAPPYGQAWRFDPPDDAGVSPAVVLGDSAYAVGAESVYAVDVRDGTLRWTAPREPGPLAPPAAALAPAAGARATPTSLLVFTQGRGDETSLAAIDTETQKLRWSVALQGDSLGGVAIDGGTAYVADFAGVVYAVDIATGDVVWQKAVQGRGDVRAAPTVANGSVYYPFRAEKDGRFEVVALDAETGERRWATQIGPLGSSASGISATEDRVLVGVGVFQGNGAAYGLDPASGEIVMTSRLRASVFPVSWPAVDDGTVYLADWAAGVYAIDAESGARDWDYQVAGTGQLFSAPVVVDGAVVVGFLDGRIVAMDATTGHEVWSTSTGQGVAKAIAVTPELLVVAKGGDRGGLIALRHDEAGVTSDLASPTTMRTGMVALGFLGAALLLGAVLLLLGRSVGLRLRAWASPSGDGSAPDADEEADADADADADVGRDPEDPDETEEGRT